MFMFLHFHKSLSITAKFLILIHSDLHIQRNISAESYSDIQKKISVQKIQFQQKQICLSFGVDCNYIDRCVYFNGCAYFSYFVNYIPHNYQWLLMILVATYNCKNGRKPLSHLCFHFFYIVFFHRTIPVSWFLKVKKKFN